MVFGCQNFMNTANATSDTNAESTSGNSGPKKFEDKNCVTANVIPDTRTAGNTSIVFFHPVIINTRKNGMKIDKIGNCRPTIFEISNAGIPVGPSIAIIGIPIAPNATGAVFAIKHKPAAYNGLNPKPTSNAADIATGAPNPAAPSKNAPKENATNNA